MKLLTYRWVTSHLRDNGIEEKKLEQSFGLAATYRGVLQVHIQRELDSIDKESTLDKLSDKPNRGEFLLAMQAKRETLNNLKQYLTDGD